MKKNDKVQALALVEFRAQCAYWRVVGKEGRG